MWRSSFGGILLLVGLSAAMTAAKSQSELTVHEWGTFLAMSGSDGMTLDGMYHEEHALPGFVHTRSRDQLRLHSALVKGETPVIYFYTDQPQQVSVRVDFPSGIWTQWYPQASLVGPSLTTATLPEPRAGHISWNVSLRPAGATDPALPVTNPDALWQFARQVDAAYVQTGGEKAKEWERFIFYRGLGQAQLPLTLREAAGGTLSLATSSAEKATGSEPEEIRHLFVLRVENGQGAFRYLPRITALQTLTGVIPRREELRPAAEFRHDISEALVQRLVEAGLYPKEARAMVNTWTTSYFQTEGIRVLAVMPQTWTDRFIPMRLDPKPQSLVRVMVARLELLTSEREKQAELAVRNLGSAEAERRDQAFNYLREQGRYVEPVLRRVLRTSSDQRVRTLCKRLLLTDFVTELRTATRSAENGMPVVEKPLGIRAQLAVLLKEVGLDQEARQTAQPLLQQLRSKPEPPMDQSGSRHYFRALARSSEAMGDDPSTARAYEKFIRFGSGVKRCGGCHEPEGPKNMAWFRDWWAGRRFATYAARAGGLEAWINAQEQALAANSQDTAAQLMLAYLYEAGGKPDRAEAMWGRIAPDTRVARRPEVTKRSSPAPLANKR